MHDILRETPIYQEILKEGREEGLQLGLQRGQLEVLGQAAVEVVAERFPGLVRLAKKQIALVEGPKLLRHLLVKISGAQSSEEVRERLLSFGTAKEVVLSGTQRAQT